MTPTRKVTPEEGSKNARAVLRFWRIGNQSRARLARLKRHDPGAVQYGRKATTFQKEAEVLGTNVDTASKMRRVASEYTRREIDQVCALITRHRSCFGPTHLLVMLRVGERSERDRLMRRAIRERWSHTRLERAIQVKEGRREDVGRRPHVPADPQERLIDLAALADKWCHWCDAALPSLPRKLKPLVRAAIEAVNAVRTVSDAESERLRNREPS
jgi:hypothetical protein